MARQAMGPGAPSPRQPAAWSEVALAGALAAALLLYHPAAPAAASKQIGVLLVGLVGMGGTLPRLLGRGGRERWRLSWPVLGWLGLCLWYGATRLWASHPWPAWTFTWLGGAAVALTAGAFDRASVQRVARLCATMIGVGAATVTVLQAIGGGRGLELHGGQGNPNWLGLVLACSLPLQVELVVTARSASKVAKLLLASAVVLSGLALALSVSRVAWVAILVTAVIFARGKWRWLPIAAAVTLAAYGLVTGDALDAWQGRWWIWQVSLRAASDAMPFGCGLGDFPASFLDAQGKLLWQLDATDATLRFTNATTAHNDWLEAAVTGGPLAVALLSVVVTLAIGHHRHSWPAGAGCALTLGICALGDSPLHQPAAVVLLMLVCAATPRARFHRSYQVVHAAVLASVVLALPASATRWLGHHAVSRARAARPAARLAWLERACRVDPRSGEAALELGLARLDRGDPVGALPHLERSRRLLANLGTDVAIGNARLSRGDPARAIDAYRRALERHPGYFRAHANMVEALRLLGRLAQAERHLAIARLLQPGHPKLSRLAERLRRARIEAETR